MCFWYQNENFSKISRKFPDNFFCNRKIFLILNVSNYFDRFYSIWYTLRYRKLQKFAGKCVFDTKMEISRKFPDNFSCNRNVFFILNVSNYVDRFCSIWYTLRYRKLQKFARKCVFDTKMEISRKFPDNISVNEIFSLF